MRTEQAAAETAAAPARGGDVCPPKSRYLMQGLRVAGLLVWVCVADVNVYATVADFPDEAKSVYGLGGLVNLLAEYASTVMIFVILPVFGYICLILRMQLGWYLLLIPTIILVFGSICIPVVAFTMDLHTELALNLSAFTGALAAPNLCVLWIDRPRRWKTTPPEAPAESA